MVSNMAQVNLINEQSNQMKFPKRLVVIIPNGKRHCSCNRATIHATNKAIYNRYMACITLS